MRPDRLGSDMELRGERECTDCGTRWSYYDTGTISCPECESVRSVGVGDREVHTDGQATLDLTDLIARIDDEPISELADRAAEHARSYVREAGFVHGGELRPLSSTYLLADELVVLGRTLSRAVRIDDTEAAYFLGLVRATATGEGDELTRPAPDTVPSSLRAERGIAITRSVRDYQRDLRAHLDEPDGELASVLSALSTHRKRIEALDGDVDPREVERLVAATHDLYDFVSAGDETALARTRDRLED